MNIQDLIQLYHDTFPTRDLPGTITPDEMKKRKAGSAREQKIITTQNNRHHMDFTSIVDQPNYHRIDGIGIRNGIPYGLEINEELDTTLKTCQLGYFKGLAVRAPKLDHAIECMVQLVLYDVYYLTKLKDGEWWISLSRVKWLKDKKRLGIPRPGKDGRNHYVIPYQELWVPTSKLPS